MLQIYCWYSFNKFLCRVFRVRTPTFGICNTAIIQSESFRTASQLIVINHATILINEIWQVDALVDVEIVCEE